MRIKNIEINESTEIINETLSHQGEYSKIKNFAG
jgi:hypothetical protein